MKIKSLMKRVSVAVLVFFLVPALVGIPLSAGSDSNGQKERVIKGAEVITIKGATIHWKDADKTPLDLRRSPRRMRPVLNFERNLPIVRQDNEADPVVQTSFTTDGQKLGRVRLMPSPLKNFEGMYQSAHGAGWPPDTTGDVGSTYFVQAVNTSIGIFRKSDGGLVSATTFNDFFSGSAVTGTPCDSSNNGDPIVLYDQYSQRWFILDFAWASSETDGSWFSIAASKTSDPTGEWWLYAFRADTTLMNDYPKAGVWHDGIYITANMFQFSGSAQGARIWALKKPDIYNGTLTAQTVFDSSDAAWSILPANAKGTNAPLSTAPCYMYAMDASEYGTGHTDALYAWKYDVDWTNSSNTTWTGPSTMTAASFGLVATGASQPSTSQTLDTLYGRLMFSAMYRRFSTYEAVYLTHLAEYSSRRAVRWYEVRISSGTSSIYQQGTYSPDANHRFMGSIGADKNGNIALGYSVSSTSVYPSVRYAGRLAADTLGELSQGEATMVAGAGYQSGTNRWGDYSTMTIDPDDDETFWYTQEYYSASGTNWRTRIGAFKVTGTIVTGGLKEAVDNDTLTLTSSGNADWTRVTDVYYYDSDSAKSGTITHSQTSSMETTVNYTVEKSVKFYWKVSSEASYDYLRFYVDGTLKDQIAGTVDWQQKSYNITAGSHTLKWTYYKDGSVSSGSDCGWVDKVEIADPVVITDPLAEALDITGLTFTTSGTGTWTKITDSTANGSDSAKSPTITHSQSSSFQTTISGYTTIKFYWKVSSESGYDYLRFYVDGTLKNQISGTAAWAQKTYTVTSGSHTIKWTYYKDGSVSSGSDCGWVDKLELQ